MHLAACKTIIHTCTCTICMKRQWMRLFIALSGEALPCQSQTPPALFPLLSPHPLLPWVRLSLLHHPFLSGYVSITPSSPGYACTITPPLLGTPLSTLPPPPPLGIYASLRSITPLASPVVTFPPALSPLLL